MIQKSTLKYTVALPLQLDLRSDMTPDEVKNAFEFQGQTFLELAIMAQDLHEEADDMRKNLGLIQTLERGVKPTVEVTPALNG
jgi:hypothetical protein